MEALDVGVGVHERHGVGAPLQVAEQVGVANVEFVTEALANEARRRRVDEQLGGEVQQVNFPAGREPRHHAVHLGGDGLGVAPHVLVPQALVVQHLPSPLGAGVEHDALAEHRGHERVRLRLVEFLLAGPEEHFVGLGATEEHHVPVGEGELANVTAFVAYPPHQLDGVVAQVLEVPGDTVPARHPGRVGQRGSRSSGGHRFLTVVGRVAMPRTLMECTRVVPASSMS